mmetsp:Transcript_23349/g.51096  ORF Transcript_23349/g.51096 Transcript_23349/m.51096 type:complete len:285 (+) Transcript_23349:33-887(+)|eukprot:CAMPEP_0168211722 /NCGR_PEP_ID=MMETSP0140_2-20121125/3869_1 /TAXON_ID=44445 /ORGANISM="Pseudo-nitzschia australis, Strain 10249 10 AB" /LENGTH=284 /DNA_ID=CAMNT_0008138437 /DNA_START=27 /DNA_END=881 /DNA_ORIENTATION=-
MDYQHHDIRSFCRYPDEQQHHEQQVQTRNGMKRSRDYRYSPLVSADCTSDPSCDQITKRLKRMSHKDYSAFTNEYSNNNGNTSSYNGLLLPSKSDDEASLAEEARASPTAFPHHSSSILRTQIQHQHQHQHQHRNHQRDHPPVNQHHQTAASSGNACTTTENAPAHATDYQPMNSLLGNLHAMRQQQQRRKQISSSIHETQGQAQAQAQARNFRVPIPQLQQLHQQQQQYQQQHRQEIYHRNDNFRHYGNYHSVPTSTTDSVVSGDNRSGRKNVVSLRVNSNLY